jgi:NADH-quinone oxidoreductase subunit F
VDRIRAHLLVCAGTGCVSCGAFSLKEALEKEIVRQGLQDEVLVIATGCNGFCERGPIVNVHPDNIFYQRLTIADVPHLVEEHLLKGRPVAKHMYVPSPGQPPVPRMSEIEFFKHQRLIVLRNRGRIDPERIEDYIAYDGYDGMAKALSAMTPEAIIAEITASGLRGRGGAGFPTGRKWDLCRREPATPRYIICNGDEGDPGAFMDRSVLEADPHAVLEGMVIGAKAIGAAKGFIYIRDEYPMAVSRVGIAIRRARESGLLGRDILDTGFDFDLEIVRGAGAFVSGEETALIASIEGQRAFPRQRPPYPAQHGLWGKPTVINNVETWANVPSIIRRGAAWFSGLGTATSKGTKIFSLVGKINNTGLVEVPMGIRLRDIVFGIGGGIPGGRRFKAVQIGGPSGGCLPTELLDLTVDYESLTQAGAMMGSGGMIVLDEDTCMVDMALYFLRFTMEESCGKCAPCRIGTRQMAEILARIADGVATKSDLERLEALAWTVKRGSLCGLGQTAPNAVLSTLRYFRDEYLAHIDQKKCPSIVCKEIVSSPCHYICPIGQEASTYIALIAKGQYEEAFNIIMKDNPLPSVCGRACHHPCEKVCRAGKAGEPISIRALKRFVMDWAAEHGISFTVSGGAQDRDKVAIIGAGPAGLTAGYSLALKGFRPTIFESLPEPGGMLCAGIPEHRLPRKVLKKEIADIAKAGVGIRTNTRIGSDLTLDDLFAQGYKAVFLATGSWKSVKMGIPGEDAQGVIQSLDYLRRVNLQEAVSVGKRVVVVGGGNSAIDAARVAIREKQCEKVTILYRRTKAEMPAFPEEVDAAIEEGVDVQFLVAPVKVVTEDGRAIAAECLRMKLGEKDASGRRAPVPIPGSEFTIGFDTLIQAIGERPDTTYIPPELNIRLARENIVTNGETTQTSREGVFAGGDAVTGPNTIIEAMAAGKAAAKAIEKYLSGQTAEEPHRLIRPTVFVPPVPVPAAEAAGAKRPEMPHLPPGQRAKTFREVEMGLDEIAACKEARRCLRCDLDTKDAKAALETDS